MAKKVFKFKNSNQSKTKLRQESGAMTIAGQIGIIIEKLGAEEVAKNLGVSKTTVLRWSNHLDVYLPNAKQLIDMDIFWCQQTGGKPFVLPFLNKKLAVMQTEAEKILKADLEEETLFCASLAVDMAMAVYAIQNSSNKIRNKSIKEVSYALVMLRYKLDIVEAQLIANKVYGLEVFKKETLKKKMETSDKKDKIIENYLKQIKDSEKELHFLISNVYKIIKNSSIPFKKEDAIITADILEDVANKLIDMADYYRYSASKPIKVFGS